MSKVKKILMGIGIGVGVVILAAGGTAFYLYESTASHYSTHFYTGTKATICAPDGETVLADVDLSEMTVDEADQALQTVLDTYILTINGYAPEGQTATADIISGKDISYALTADGNQKLENTLAAQDSKTWFKHTSDYRSAVTNVTVQLSASYKASKVESMLDGMKCITPDVPTEGKDAYLAYNEEDYLYEIVESEHTNCGDKEAILSKVEAALDAMEPELTLEETDYLEPAITSENEALVAKRDEIDKYLLSKITVKDGDKEIVIDGSVIIDFLDIDETEWTVSLNKKKIQKYVNANFDDLFDTVGCDRTITTNDSGTFTVTGGTFGKTVKTLDEVAKLYEEISEGAVEERTPCYYNTYEQDTNGGVGDTYIDVNIAKQKVYVVIDGKTVITTDCVTGLDNEERRTPTGVYFVIRKVTDYTMVKYDSFVNYWMPINDTTGVGLHDATWRSNFGGTIYKYSGSHGCINLPLNMAEKIYNTVSVGIPVIVH